MCVFLMEYLLILLSHHVLTLTFHTSCVLSNTTPYLGFNIPLDFHHKYLQGCSHKVDSTTVEIRKITTSHQTQSSDKVEEYAQKDLCKYDWTISSGR